MKRDRKSRELNLQLYKQLDSDNNIEDTRYWGMFGTGAKGGKIKIDPIRYQKKIGIFSKDQLKIINNRKTHYFIPKKYYYDDYSCNVFMNRIKEIKKDWFDNYKGLILREVKRIQKPEKLCAADDDNFMCGITDYEESSTWAIMKNIGRERQYNYKKFHVLYSLYSQFFHMMASQIEAITVYVLSSKGKEIERFDRNALYNYSLSEGSVRDFDNFKYHDKLYCIWNFIKHNSLTTYKKLKDRYPECLVEEEFKAGYLGYSFIKFNDELIESLIDGCGEFFKEFCYKVYGEDYNEAQWNYSKYFIDVVYSNIDNIVDPLGLNYYI